MAATTPPSFVINSHAPVRICDNGGWTDTWFAQHGTILNMAVSPCAQVHIEVRPRNAQTEQFFVHAENYNETFSVAPQLHAKTVRTTKHALIEACFDLIPIPQHLALNVNLFCAVPAGASTGTSAAITVALIGALDALTPGRMSQHEVAYAAQRVETVLLNRQCGIQDQLCAAYGGINYIEMFRYPHASVSQLQLPATTLWELEQRLVLIFLGKTHDSSAVHQAVIQDLENAGPDDARIQDLRHTAAQSKEALFAQDFAALGNAMRQNTAAQARLHAGLVSHDAQKIIKIAQAHGALGWKVNGAGGEGGSITLLGGAHPHQTRAMVYAIEHENPLFRAIPIRLSPHGLRVWQT